jgi:hypothetical protein
MTDQQNLFSQFTNKYSLSKTLRFELKPVGKTKDMLEDARVFEKDRLIKKKYIKTKPYFDRLHRDFIKEALSSVSLPGLDEYLLVLENWQMDKKSQVAKKNLQKKEQELRSEVLKIINDKSKEWAKTYENIGLKNINIELFFEESVFKLLNEKYGNDKDAHILDDITGKSVSIFDDWKGFTGYFSKFQATRRNLYKDDGTFSALATRIIDQNLKRFADNMQIFEKIRSKLDYSEIENNFAVNLSEIFSMNYYNQCLLQDGIDKYNKILGGETRENGEKIKGFNELVNRYRQDNKGEKLPFLKPLDRQILSEKEKFIVGIEDDKDLQEKLKQSCEKAGGKIEILKTLFAGFTHNNEEYNLKNVYISNDAFNTISQRWTRETRLFEELLYESMKQDKLTGLKYEKKEDSYKFPDFIALSYIKTALENSKREVQFWKDRYYIGTEVNGCLTGDESAWEQFLIIFEFEFSMLFKKTIKNESGDEKLIGFDIFKEELTSLISGKEFSVNQESKIVIKNFADSVLSIYQMGKYFAIEKKRAWVEEYDLDVFYTDPQIGYLKFYENAYEDIVQTYNHLRNYLTKKPYSEDKWKLNFENSTLAGGWDKNKESDNSVVILRKEGTYYLGLMKKGHNKIFDDRYEADYSQNLELGKYEKMVYKFFPDQAKMFPKVCFSEKGLKFFRPSDEIMRIYKNAEFKKGESFSLNSMHKMIDFYKNCLITYDGWKHYDFKNIKQTQEYRENIGEFFADVAKDGYLISFRDISDIYIKDKNSSGDLYLFEIHNKDWNLKDGQLKTGTKNLHTLYFQSLFSSENKQGNFPIKLNGQAEIFFRPKTEIKKLGKKKDRDGKEVIDHKRYSEDKIFFHCPIALNRGKGDAYKFNSEINAFLANNPNINIIGVDRGEKHLAYYSVIDQKGNRLESGSLNEINGIKYAEKLEGKAGDREKARRDWQMVEGIKDLKKGYISCVVRKLADLIIKHNAIIVFEDLNMRFKQVRGGIEKSVYQQLEKALIEKLNFFVQKGEVNSEKAGHILKAYQLTAPIIAFKDMGKQTGIMYYTQASYTSKVDPLTGWRPNLYLKYSNAKQAKENILKFKEIRFNKDDNRFEFTYDLKNFQIQKEYPKRTEWTLCSSVERFRWNKKLNNNKGGYDYYPASGENSLTTKFKNLFQSSDVNFETGSLLLQLGAVGSDGNEKFFRDFIFLFNLICQIRNTNSNSVGDENDFIFSPIEPFFDSRKAKEFDKNMPMNGDENGAYNIARKGVILLNRISNHAKEDPDFKTDPDLFISNTAWDSDVSNWDDFVTNK